MTQLITVAHRVVGNDPWRILRMGFDHFVKTIGKSCFKWCWKAGSIKITSGEYSNHIRHAFLMRIRISHMLFIALTGLNDESNLT